MNFCPYCGAALPGGAAAFCPECGKALSVCGKKPAQAAGADMPNHDTPIVRAVLIRRRQWRMPEKPQG